MTATEQRRSALQTANRIRFAQCDLKRELAAGVVTLAQALDDPRAVGMSLFKVLEAQYKWGTYRTSVVHRKTGIDSRRRVGTLTDGQKARIVSAA